MSSINKGFISLCLPLLALLLMVSGCEDPGNVGGGLVDNSELKFDTLSFTGVETIQLNGYSGSTTFLPLGRYEDPAFGTVEFRNLIKPEYETVSSNDDPVDDSYSMKLVIELDSLRVYGDTLGTSSFTLYEVNELWRSSDWTIDKQINYDSSNPVGTFSISQEDTAVVVDLADSWKDKYTVYFNDDSTSDIDSLYSYNFFGLAIIPDESSSRVEFTSTPATFMLQSEEDTVNISAGDWAYSLSRSGETAYPAETIPLHSTLENVIRIDTSALNLDYFRGRSYTRVSLVFQEANDFLDQSLPMDAVRMDAVGLRLDSGYDYDLLYELQFSAPSRLRDVTASKDTSSFKYSFNITELVNNYVYGTLDESDIYVSAGSGSGILVSTLLYGPDAPASVRPKLIVTSLSEEEE